MGKAKVALLKSVSIPRHELIAAIYHFSQCGIDALQRIELQQSSERLFHTDSSVVLGYIGNEARRYHMYVSNNHVSVVTHDPAADLNPEDPEVKKCKVTALIMNHEVTKWKEEKLFPKVLELECFNHSSALDRRRKEASS